jgi:hypothetical protein
MQIPLKRQKAEIELAVTRGDLVEKAPVTRQLAYFDSLAPGRLGDPA